MGVVGSSGVTQVIGDVDTTIDDGVGTTDESFTTSTAQTKTWIVPVGEVWVVKLCTSVRSYAGTFEVRINTDGTDVSMNYAASVTYHTLRVYDMVLKAGDTIMAIAGAGTSGAIRLGIAYLKKVA